jgi:hypothetical protein
MCFWIEISISYSCPCYKFQPKRIPYIRVILIEFIYFFIRRMKRIIGSKLYNTFFMYLSKRRTSKLKVTVVIRRFMRITTYGFFFNNVLTMSMVDSLTPFNALNKVQFFSEIYPISFALFELHLEKYKKTLITRYIRISIIAVRN